MKQLGKYSWIFDKNDKPKHFLVCILTYVYGCYSKIDIFLHLKLSKFIIVTFPS